MVKRSQICQRPDTHCHNTKRELATRTKKCILRVVAAPSSSQVQTLHSRPMSSPYAVLPTAQSNPGSTHCHFHLPRTDESYQTFFGGGDLFPFLRSLEHRYSVRSVTSPRQPQLQALQHVIQKREQRRYGSGSKATRLMCQVCEGTAGSSGSLERLIALWRSSHACRKAVRA